TPAGPRDAATRAPSVGEARYRPPVGQYLLIAGQPGPHSLFTVAKRQWPTLLFLFRTAHPEGGRAAFRTVRAAAGGPGGAVTALDLHNHDGLRIFRQNVEEHEALLRRMFALLTGG